MKRVITLTVNGERYEATVRPGQTLVDVLRRELGLTGTKEGCDVGECGVCTVLLDGIAVRGCLTLAVDVRGREVVTVEGLMQDGRLHPIQEAFVRAGAIQCGFCTPGAILVTKALLDETPRPTEAEIREALSGNLCRCTGYGKIIDAVQAAAQALAGLR